MEGQFQPRFVDLVRSYSTTSGTGDFVVGAAVNGFRSFADACAAGDTFYYSASNADFPAEHEVGRGTLNADGTISRDPISGTKTDFSAGTKSIALVAASEWFDGAQALIGNATPLGQSLLSAATANDARSALEISGGFNVKSFGAKGDSNADGSQGTDDTAAIQAALDHVNSIGGGTVFFPEGFYKVSSYLTVYPYTAVVGSGRRGSTIVGVHEGGGGATQAENVRNGSILYSACPVNTTSAAHIAIERLCIVGPGNANQGAGFYQQAGDSVIVRNCEFGGCKWGVILDQSEDVTIETSELGSVTDGGAGLWIVNGGELNPLAVPGYTNIVSVVNCHMNVGSTSYGIVDDGGNGHVFINPSFNGGVSGLRLAGGNAVLVTGGYAESQSSHIFSLNTTTLSGGSVGGNVLTINGGVWVANSGKGTVFCNAGAGTLVMEGCLCIGGGGTASIVGAANLYALYLLGVSAVTPADGVAGGTNIDLGKLNQAKNGELTVPNELRINGASGTVRFLRFQTAKANSSYIALGVDNVSHLHNVPTGGAHTFQVNIAAVASLSAAGMTLTGTLAATGAITSSGGGVGYAAGAGGTVTQSTSKSAGVTINKYCGQIIMNAAALAANASVSFTVTNSQVAATDTVLLVLQGGNATAGTYNYQIDKVSAGSFVVWVKNVSGGALSEALSFNFSIKKAVAA